MLQQILNIDFREFFHIRHPQAPKLIAATSELDALAAGIRDLPMLHGWRNEVFGTDALRLCQGEIALSAIGGAVRVVTV